MAIDSRIASFTFFIVSILLAMAPFLFNKIRRIKKMFPRLIIFSAGMMLSAALNDLVPHIAEHKSHDHGHDHGHKHDHGCDHDHSPGHAHVHEFNFGLFVSGLSFIFLLMIDTFITNHAHCEKDKKEQHNHEEHSHEGHNHEGHTHKEQNHEGHSHPEADCCTDAIKYTTSKLQAFIFVLMISIHSFLEGLGIQTYKTIIPLFVHKIIESISIGLTVFSANFSLRFAFFLNLTYSLLTPLGLLAKSLPFAQKIDWFLNGLALGSIFFIVFVEMIPPHFHKKGNPLHKILLLLSGYTLSSLFTPLIKLLNIKS